VFGRQPDQITFQMQRDDLNLTVWASICYPQMKADSDGLSTYENRVVP
jgi:hypothetical protein